MDPTNGSVDVDPLASSASATATMGGTFAQALPPSDTLFQSVRIGRVARQELPNNFDNAEKTTITSKSSAKCGEFFNVIFI